MTRLASREIAVFLDQVCPGLEFDTIEDWIDIYASAGLGDLETETGPFEMMTGRGSLAGEGLARCLAIMPTVASRPTYLRKMAWLMPRTARAAPCPGYIIVAGAKPR
jgi:hypothetical protein